MHCMLIGAWEKIDRACNDRYLWGVQQFGVASIYMALHVGV